MNPNPIKLYAPEQYREPKIFTHIELLFPFWGVTAKESAPYVRTASFQYQYSAEDFILTDDIADADYVVVPYNYERLRLVNPERLSMIIREAKEGGKIVLIDGSGDLEYPIDVTNSVVFRVSQYRYSREENEITIPFVAEDLLESYANGTLQIREKQECPSVGFTGWAEMSLKKRIKTYFKELPVTLATFVDGKRGAEHKGILFRERALRALKRHSGVEGHFTTRATYSGHVKTIQGAVADNRREFVENLLDSDYALCVRGDANSSVRFYEALSLGRIPLFLDTECVLPLEDKINYRDFCVFVDWKDIDRIGDVLADFHSKLSPEKFKEMQRKARATYIEHLRVDAFSKELAFILRKRLSEMVS